MKIEIVIPVYNEEAVLYGKIGELFSFLQKNCTGNWQISIVDNGSTDGTFKEMGKLSSSLPKVKIMNIQKKGRGRALKYAWGNSKSDFVCYMDVDLSTDLSAFLKMIDCFKNGADIVTGSRLHRESKVKRCLRREILSRGYNIFHRLLLQTHFTDAQCGFKGFKREVIQYLLPLAENNEWFLDTELLILGEKLGFRIVEIPVIWNEDTDSSVNIPQAVVEDMKGLFRMRHKFK